MSPRRRSLGLTVGLVVLVGCLIVASLAIGARPTTLATVWHALTHFVPTDGDQLVVRARIARTVDGLVVGSALGLAGATMQGITRNPLADPGILGVNAGAAAAIVAGIGVLGVSSVAGMAVLGTAGAMIAFVVVFAVASLAPGGSKPVTLAIAGAAVNAGLTSLMAAVLVIQPAALDRFRSWQAGVLGVRGVAELPAAIPFLVVGAVLCLVTARGLNLLAMGDDTAAALGSRVGLLRATASLGSVLLAGTATALVGPVGFVGLVVPHLLRPLVGPDHRVLLPLSALTAPALLLLADTVGRVAMPPGEIQVGVMTAVLGAPVMIALIRRRGTVSL